LSRLPEKSAASILIGITRLNIMTATVAEATGSGMDYIQQHIDKMTITVDCLLLFEQTEYSVNRG